MRQRRVLPALMVAVMPLTAAADDNVPATVDKGHLIIYANCSACHATETDDTSLNAAAPTFRDISHRYPPAELGEALAEGIVTGHPGMPEFVFQPDEIEAIIAYLEWLRAR